MKMHSPKISITAELISWTNEIAEIYLAPVYLVGSSLWNDNYRDVDIACIMSDLAFAKRWGDVETWIQEGITGQWSKHRWSWSETCVRHWELGCKSTRFNLDFKIIPATYDHRDFPEFGKYRLDTTDAPNPQGIYLLNPLR